MRRIAIFGLAAVTGLPAVLSAQTLSFADVWMGGPLDSIYNAEYERVQGACRGQGDACYAAELDGTPVPLAPVYDAPEAGRAPVGWIAAQLRPQGRWPYAALVFQGTDGREVTLLEDLGDWGYGTTLALAEHRTQWLRPWLLEESGGYWLSTEGGPGYGIVDGPYGVEGRLWRLGRVESAGTTLPAGVYMILGVEGGTVSLRAEVPQDMDCGGAEDDVPAGPEPETHRIPVQALLDASGRPAVEVAYPRGC
jgi:hypothetical protein